MNEPVTFPPARPARDRGIWLMQVPVISTEHLASRDIEYLYDRDTSLMQTNDGDSCLLCIDDEDDYTAGEDGITPAGQAVLTHFRELGYSYLRLDPNGMLVAGLPTVFLDEANHTLPITIATPLL